MQRRRTDPFPFVAVRDLLGILRALWLATDETQSVRRREIAALAHELRVAYELALTTNPGTMGHSAAWQRAEDATRKLGGLVDCVTPLEPLMNAAAARVIRTHGGLRRKPPVGH